MRDFNFTLADGEEQQITTPLRYVHVVSAGDTFTMNWDAASSRVVAREGDTFPLVAFSTSTQENQDEPVTDLRIVNDQAGSQISITLRAGPEPRSFYGAGGQVQSTIVTPTDAAGRVQVAPHGYRLIGGTLYEVVKQVSYIDTVFAANSVAWMPQSGKTLVIDSIDIIGYGGSVGLYHYLGSGSTPNNVDVVDDNAAALDGSILATAGSFTSNASHVLAPNFTGEAGLIHWRDTPFVLADGNTNNALQFEESDGNNDMTVSLKLVEVTPV